MWDEYVAQRKKDKKEMGPTAIKGRIKRLYELHAAGHDVNLCIEEAINGHWLDFYEPHDKGIKVCANGDAERTSEYLRQESERRSQCTPPPDNLRRLRREHDDH